jgi:hypothetical protein
MAFVTVDHVSRTHGGRRCKYMYKPDFIYFIVSGMPALKTGYLRRFLVVIYQRAVINALISS